jgi:hypothetical protein
MSIVNLAKSVNSFIIGVINVSIEKPKDKRMFVSLGKYLTELEEKQKALPLAHRRQIPTIAAIVKSIRVRHPESKLHSVTVYNLAKGNIKLLNLDTAQLLLDELWYMGFKPSASDFLTYEPPEE